jgi:hypothetical protein
VRLVAEAAADCRRCQQIVRVEGDRLIVRRRHVAAEERLAPAVLIVDADHRLLVVAIDVIAPQQLAALRSRPGRLRQTRRETDGGRAVARRIHDAIDEVGIAPRRVVALVERPPIAGEHRGRRHDREGVREGLGQESCSGSR